MPVNRKIDFKLRKCAFLLYYRAIVKIGIIFEVSFDLYGVKLPHFDRNAPCREALTDVRTPTFRAGSFT